MEVVKCLLREEQVREGVCDCAEYELMLMGFLRAIISLKNIVCELR